MAPIPSNTPAVRVAILRVADGTADVAAAGTGIAVVGPAAAMMNPPAAAAAAAAVSRLSCLLRFIVSSSVMGVGELQGIGSEPEAARRAVSAAGRSGASSRGWLALGDGADQEAQD